MFFIRNFGDEGQCSSSDHQVDAEHLTLDLPLPSTGADSVPTVFVRDRFALGDGGVTSNIYVDSNNQVHIVAYLPNPATHPVLYGEISVYRPGFQPPADCEAGWETVSLADQSKLAHSLSAAASGIGDAGEGLGPEDLEDDMATAMGLTFTAAQYSRFYAYRDIIFAPPVSPSQPVLMPVIYGEPPQLASPPTVSDVPSFLEMERTAAGVNSLCVVAGGVIPAIDGGCDPEPPITEYSIIGGKEGNGGWRVTATSVSLTPHAANLSGIASTEFAFFASSWSKYSSPVAMPEGFSKFYFRSIDGSGNYEQTHDLNFAVDTVPPTITYSISKSDGGLDIDYVVSDPTPGSGAAGLEYKSDAPGVSISGFSPGASGRVHLNTLCADLELWGVDNAGNQQTPHVHSVDRTPPKIVVNPSQVCLWPPNGKEVELGLSATFNAKATDVCDPSPSLAFTGLSSNEPTSPGEMSFSSTDLCVNQSRLGTGSGRFYTGTITSSDYAGNVSTVDVSAEVPHDQGNACVGTSVIGTSVSSCP
jgi:hypothetical protein